MGCSPEQLEVQRLLVSEQEGACTDLSPCPHTDSTYWVLQASLHHRALQEAPGFSDLALLSEKLQNYNV